MVSINSNYAASFAANAAKQTNNVLNKAIEKLSTGKRINYARDDAAGQAIASRLTAEIQGLATASRNASDAQGLIDTADGALKETNSLLQRLRELAVQSSNGTLTSADRASLQAEAAALEEEIYKNFSEYDLGWVEFIGWIPKRRNYFPNWSRVWRNNNPLYI